MQPRLAEQQRRGLEEIFEATSDFVALAEADGRMSYVNAAGRQLTGFDLDADITATAMIDFIPATGVRRFTSVAMATAIEQGIWRGETTFRARDGREFPTSQVVVAHRSASGELESFSTIARDISREKHAEALVGLHAAILARVARHEPLPVVLDALAQAIEQLAQGMLASVLLIDDTGTHLHHGGAPSLPDAYNKAIDGVAIGPAVGSCGTAAHRRTPVFSTDIASDALWTDFQELAAEHDLRACWSTPICADDGEVLGTFALYYREPRAPTDTQLELIDAATHLARMAIEHERAERRLRYSEARFRTVATDVPVGIFQADVEGNNVFANEHLCQLLNRSAEQLRGAGWAEQIHPDDRERVVAGWQAAVTAQASWTIEFRVLCPNGSVRIVAVTGTPLRADDGSAAGFLGSYIDLTERNEAEDRRLEFEREHLIAQTLQRSLLPAGLPTIAGVEVAVRYLPGAAGMQVGGDWYDVFKLADGRLGVSLGDVVGHGLRSAAAMGELRITLRAIARMTSSPAHVLERLGDFVEGDSLMATLIYATVDPLSGRVQFACAGHPPPLLAGAALPAAYLDGGRNPPLGCSEATVRDAVVDLAVGSTLLLYTDGLVERRGGLIDDGLESLRRIVEDHEGDLEELLDDVIARLGADAAADDVSILALRRHPADR
ncbi:MAG: SpoIIE family protein phosphatase [Solirubrobacteraceae bacterium]